MTATTTRPNYSATLEAQYQTAQADADAKATATGRVYWAWLSIGTGAFRVTQDKPVSGAWAYARDFIYCTDAATLERAAEARRKGR